MSPVTVEESGLTFGPFPDDACFPVERSPLYRGLGEGVKTVEFLLARKPKRGRIDLLFVEAKTTAPRTESHDQFEKYFADLREKMLGALLLFVGARLGRHGTAAREIPAELRTMSLRTGGIRFVLVVTTAREE
jgi:hypothetical protein